ncbi:sce7726 family protein [Tistlia consotensis]|nr:sce7726 family protein [Tistlia consotensis]
MSSLDASQTSAISRLFSSAVFREMAKRGRSATFARLFAQCGIEGACPANATVGEGFDRAFAVLKKAGLRDEYIYRAAVTHKILLGKHSLNTACMLTEFRAGKSKADLVILNGTATVFEIKSERDSLARLANQVENYKKVFAAVNVIASEAHVGGVLATVSDDVGVMCLSRRYSISTIRDASDRPDRISPVIVFESLRSGEARNILRKLGVHVPDVPNTMMHVAMREAFSHLEPIALHRAMVDVLKGTRNLAPLGRLVDRLPPSLHAAALSIQVRPREHEHLVQAVSTPLPSAMLWA